MARKKRSAPKYIQPRQKTGEKIAAALEVPPDFVGASHVDILGNNRLLIEGCRRVLCYDDNIISLDMKKSHMQITGTCLCFKMINKRQMIIIGNITSVEFMSC